MNFLSATAADVTQWGRDQLNQNRDKFATFEEAAQHIVRAIYDEFRNTQDERMFALVRIFRLANEHQLPPEESTDAEGQWLTLCGTVGDETAWCNRLESAGHRVIPAGAFTTPMLKAAFEQIGLVKRDTPDEFLHEASFMANYFHVEQANGSPYIVAQDEFVIPYKIQSVVGIGSPFASKAFYMCVSFSKTRINAADAKKFAELSPYISTLMASYDKVEALWN